MPRFRLARLPAVLALALGCAGAGSGPEPAAGAAEADPRVGWLRDHAIPIRSVDPADEDFSDLRALTPVLAGRRVVILGETTHGDGTAFLAKSRLVRFLHRELGFDVLAFEGLIEHFTGAARSERPIGYKEMRARWHRVFDGVLFLDRMDISEPIPEPGETDGDGAAPASHLGDVPLRTSGLADRAERGVAVDGDSLPLARAQTPR